MRLRVVVVVGFVLSLLAAMGGAACGWDWTVVPKEAGTTEAGAKERECRSSDDCASDEYCFFADGFCGTREAGACSPNKCAKIVSGLVCGCDGRIYDESCKILAARVDTSFDRCASPAGMFRCGFHFCSESEFCIEDEKACISWAECSERGCGCAQKIAACPSSTCDVDGGATVVRCGK